MTGRELIAAIITKVQNIDNPITANDLELLGVRELVYGPEDMLVAGQHLRGQIILVTKDGD